MANDITLKPSLKSNNQAFEEYIEDIEINFKTQKGNFIGTFNSWNILINLNRSNIEVPGSIKLQLAINNKYYKTPSFYLIPTIDEETEEYIEVKGYDKSILFDSDFEWTQTLPCTAGELTQNICNKVGVILKDINFVNSDFMIYRQMVDNKRTNREVIAMIAAISGGNAFINEDDQLEIRSFINTEIVFQEYFSSEKFVKVGPITGVNLAREPIKDYKILNDNSLSAKYKSCIVKITNNLIVDDNRELAIQNIYNQLRGLEFYCKKIETHEAYGIKPFSFVQCNENKVLVDTICIKYPSLIDSYVSSNQLTEVESNLNIDRGIKKRLINAEAKVSEVEGKIKLLAEEVSEYDSKIAQMQISVDSIVNKVENDIDITREVSGATKLTLENCMKGELLELHICGNNTVFNNLYVSDDTLISDDTVIFGDSLIRVIGNDMTSELIEENVKGYVTPHYYYKNMYLCLNHTENTYNQIRYFKVRPNTKYCIFLDIEELAENETFCVGTFSKNFLEKLEEIKNGQKSDELHSNEFYGNYSWKNGFVYDKYATFLEFETEKDDEYVVIQCNGNRVEKLKICENYQEIDLGIDTVLRQKDGVFDEYILKDNKAQVIRRIGVDDNDNKYILENEKIEDLGELSINLCEGTNTIEIVNYLANMYARYVIVNDFTKKFATSVELHSLIEQLANSILLQVSQKVGDDEIIAKLNLAVKDEQGIVELIGNVVKIVSDNFTLDENGRITAKEGEIAGWKITEHGLFSREIQDEIHGEHSPSGLIADNVYIASDLNGNVFFAGRYLGKDGKPAFRVDKNGRIYGKLVDLYDNDSNNKAYIKIHNENTQVGSYMTSDTVSSYNMISGDGNVKGHCMHGRDGENGHIYTVVWTRDSVNQPYYLAFWVDNTFVAYLDNDTSDKRLKKDIEEINDNLLKAIDEIEIKQFKLKDEETIKFGVIAQEVIEIFNKYNLDFKDYSVVFQKQKYADDETLYYFVNYEQLSILKNKCLEKKIKILEDNQRNIFKILEKLEKGEK